MLKPCLVAAVLTGWLAASVAERPGQATVPAGQKPVPGTLAVRWIHGAADCSEHDDPAIQVHRYNEDTFILRQSKCVHFEAPFIYLLFGTNKAWLHDTGATASARDFPIRRTVQGIIKQWLAIHKKRSIELIVAHSHAHADHVAGDDQFADLPHTTVVGTSLPAVQKFFGITNWPEQTVTYDLGGRVLEIIPTPGHETSHLCVYDPQTQILLTGDTLYPGRLYVRDWKAYRNSINRLAAFSRTHAITHILGAHIEMSSRPGQDFPAGATFQPEEHRLELTVDHLLELQRALPRLDRGRSARDIHDDFIIVGL